MKHGIRTLLLFPVPTVISFCGVFIVMHFHRPPKQTGKPDGLVESVLYEAGEGHLDVQKERDLLRYLGFGDSAIEENQELLIYPIDVKTYTVEVGGKAIGKVSREQLESYFPGRVINHG